MALLAELKRRNVFKAGAAYLVVAWLAVQAVSIGFPAFDAPGWVLRVFILVAMLGFPVVLVMTWVFDMTPEGVKVATGTPGTKRLVGIAALIGALAVAWYFYGQPAVREAVRRDTAVASPPAPALPPVPAKSIAVLAFTDLSPKHDQDYFSDGIAEEILNALAQVKDLKVAGRTSSFHYKGRNDDLRTIGRALGVAHVLEGSVRTQGQRVRITAQLVRTADNFHVWSKAYDGTLTDVFELQERIARAITDELQVALEGGQKARLVKATTTSPEAYALYLQASGIFNRREGRRMPAAIAQLEQAARLDPASARVQSRLAAVYAISTLYRPREAQALREASRRAARAAIALDDSLAEPHAALGLMLGQQRRFVEERDEFTSALALEPDDVNANFWFATSLIDTGYTRLGVQALDRVLAIDPLLPNALAWRGGAAFQAGDIDAAQRLVRLARDNGLAHAGLQLSLLAARRGDKAEARRQLAEGLRALVSSLPADAPDVLAAGVYGDAAARERALALIEAILARDPHPVSGALPLVLLRMHRPALALRAAQAPTDNDAMFMSQLWAPDARQVRQLPQFAAFVRRSGLGALWDRHGAPDLCRQVEAQTYACD